MRHSELDKKRLEPMVAEVYAAASGPTSEVYPQCYDTWKKHPVWGFWNDKPVTIVPSDCYFLPHEEQKKIEAKWCKGLRGFWYYIPKLDYHDKDYKKKCKELDDFRKFEDEVSKDKSLTYAQRAAKIKKEALAHNFRWRSTDKEYIGYNYWLGISVAEKLDVVNRCWEMYNAIDEAYNRNLIKNLYIDYPHEKQFYYTHPKYGGVYVRVEHIDYEWNSTAKKHIPVEKPDREFANIYNENGEWIEKMWNYNNVVRTMAAETLDIMIMKALPHVKAILKEWKRGDTLQYMEMSRSRAERDFKQAMALFIQHLWWLDENK